MSDQKKTKAQLMQELQELRDQMAELQKLASERGWAGAMLAGDRQSEQLLRSIIDATPDWIFVKDQEHRYRLANQGYANALHLKPQDFIGKDDLDLGFPEELVKGNPEKGIRGFWADDRLVMDSGQPQVYPNDPATIDGVVHTFHTIKTPLRDANGNVWGVLAFARDVTDLQQVEGVLRQNQAQLSEALNVARLAYWEFDVPSQMFTFNDQLYSLFHTTAEREGGYQMSAADFARKFVHPDDAQIVGVEIGKAIETTDPNYSAQFESRVIRGDSQEGDIAVRVRILKDAQGHTLKMYGTNQDITERKQAEFLLNQRVKELDCLNDIGRKVEEASAMSEFLPWVAERISPAMQYPAKCLVAIEFEGQVHGKAEALKLPCQIVGGLHVGGEQVGRLCVAYTEEHGFLDEESALLGSIVRRVSGYIENRRLLEEAKSRLAQLTALQETTKAVASTLELGKLLHLITQQATSLLQSQGGIINLVDWEKREDEVVASSGSAANTLGERSSLESNLSGWVSLHNQPVISNQLQHDSRANVGAGSWQSAAIAPLTVKDRVVGTLVILDKQGRKGEFDQADLDLLIAFANQAAIAIQNVRLFEETKAALVETKTLAEALRVSEERFALATKGANDGLWDWDIQGKSLYWSPRFKELLGYADDELQIDFETFNSLMHPDDRAPTGAAIDAHLKDRVLYNVEQRLLAKSGAYRWFRARGQAVWDEAGNPIRMVGFSTDITERKQAEFLLNQRVKELDCLNDIGRKVEEASAMSEFLPWVAERISPAMQYPAKCLVAIEFEGQVYGKAEALKLPCQMVGSLHVGDEQVGRLCVAYTGEHDFLDEESALLGSIVRRVSGYIENRRLQEQTQARTEQVAVLNELSQSLTARLSVEGVMQEVHRGVSRLVDASNFYVSLYAPDKNEVTFPLQYVDGKRIEPEDAAPANLGFTGYLIRTRTPLLLRDKHPGVEEARLGVENVQFAGKLESKCWLGVPMIIEDLVLGTMVVLSYTDPYAFNEHDRDMLVAIASQTTIALQNAQLFEQARTHAEEMVALNELSRALATRLSVDQVLEEVYRGVSRLLDVTNFYISLYHPEKDEVSFPINVSESVVDRRITVLPADQGITGYIIRTHESVLIKSDVNGWLAERGMPHVGEPAQSWLGVPLMIGDQVQGVMAVQSYTTLNAYDEHDRDLLVAIASQAAITLQNARSFEQAQARARREQMLREVTARLRGSTDPDAVMRALARELGTVLGRPTFVRLVTPEGGKAEELTQAPATQMTGGEGQVAAS